MFPAQRVAPVMPSAEGMPSSPAGPFTSSEDALAYYKAEYESLEAELADFQDSSKALEAELERDVEQSEKRERELKEKTANLNYEVEEWKTKHKQANAEANAAQNRLQREITTLRDTNRSLQLRLRDIEVANDDYERNQRRTASSLEDMESKYSQTIERGVLLEEEMRASEQEREALRIDAQRLRDELSDLRIEADITKEKLRAAEERLDRRKRPAPLQPIVASGSTRSEHSPTASTTSLDTPAAKTASSSGLSDTPTPPSPPMSEKSTNVTPRPFATPSIPKTRISRISMNTTPRPSVHNKPLGQSQRPSILVSNGRSTPSVSHRQSRSKLGPAPQRLAGLPQSNSIYQLRNLRGKMQKLEERVANARSKLPAPARTPSKASPRSASALGQNVPSTVTVRSSRKHGGGSNISGNESLPDHQQNTPSIVKPKSSLMSFGLPRPTPTGAEMAAPPPRPASRANASSQSSANASQSGHRRPGSRASVSNLRAPLGGGIARNRAPNASTDRVRPQSSLSSYGTDGTVDEEDDHHSQPRDHSTPTPRRTTFGRASEIGSSLPTPSKRTSIGHVSKLATFTSASRKPSGLFKHFDDEEMRPPPSRDGKTRELDKVGESLDLTNVS